MPKKIYLKNYCKPDFQIPETDLNFYIHDNETIVKAILKVVSDTSEDKPLVLDRGKDVKLKSVKIDGKKLTGLEYRLTKKHLKIPEVPRDFTLEIETKIKPHENEELEGLYKSGDLLCTQCEAEGFRNITFFPDRPDVMSVYKTRIEADKDKFPVLLSNGNKVERGDLESGRHFVSWKDPFKKPSYLFALVAGDLGVLSDKFRTKSGRGIDLSIYVEQGKEQLCKHAMESLKKAMEWDEKTFNFECDLDNYMIAAVNDFNAGAMENKGLNIFNAKYILADPRIATDIDYNTILLVIAHEYFHNWTGNRITLRDWFQLTLKEGLTTYRHQRFMEDMIPSALERIKDAKGLRETQFVEDKGPNAHPIRPESVITIDNFYTTTVYEKSAAVHRMLATLVGEEAFMKGIEKYVELFDGKAITAEDFIHAMEIASGIDLAQFKNWYNQAGTPMCNLTTKYDEKEKTYSVTVEQSCPPTPECKRKKPFYFPLDLSLVGKNGKDLVSKVLHITKSKETFVFENIPEKPIPSFFRNFSAPVNYKYDYSNEELAFLMVNDNDDFNRYEAGQRLAIIELEKIISDIQKGETPSMSDAFLDAFGELLRDKNTDKGLLAKVIDLPSVTTLAERMDVCDYDSAFKAREFLEKELAKEYETVFISMYNEMNDNAEYSIDQESISKRSLKKAALGYLAALKTQGAIKTAYAQFENADNMDDKLVGLTVLSHIDCPERKRALKSFYDEWKDNPLVMDKWFAVQSKSKLENVLEQVIELEKDAAYDSKNPNKIRSLIGAFTINDIYFHDLSGKGYRFIADKIIEIDKFNKIIAGELATAFEKYGFVDEGRRKMMKVELERILDSKPSDNVYEIVSKTLESVKD